MKFEEEGAIMGKTPKGFLINESPTVMHSPEILKPGADGRVRIKAVLQDADKRNRNKRIYPRAVLEKALQSEFVRERLATKTFYGEAGHPMTPTIQRQLYMDQSNISHIVTEVWWEGDKLMGIVEAADTQRGRDFAGLIKQGCKVGFSLRAVGPVTEKQGDTVIVKDPLTIFSYDWVIHPSHASAYMTELISESTMFGSVESSMLAESTFEPYYEGDATAILSENLNLMAEQKLDTVLSEDAKTVFIKKNDQVYFTNTDDYIKNLVESYSPLRRK